MCEKRCFNDPGGGTRLPGHGMPHEYLNLKKKKKAAVSYRSGSRAVLDVEGSFLTVTSYGGDPEMESSILIMTKTATSQRGSLISEVGL